ncbi:MAG TPA: SDR family oxidoreductase [Anaeromyxobacteraceae bacterium]|nr:SDR family oxidoreductase [Anaeromyxobacteraceae bacterium]
MWRLARDRGALRDKVILVTGGSRGLGLVIARKAAGRGARVVICARDGDELERARQDLASRGADVLAVPCDVTDPAQVQALVDATRRRFGRVDVLVNVAGIIQVGPYETLSLEDHRAAMAANYWGTVHATLAVLPEMQQRGEGQIVNITSIGGTLAVPHLLAYTASKFAAVGFSTGLAAEASRHGIRVTTIVPGLMRTGSFIRALFKGQREKEMSAFSVSASLPFVTLDADRAARRIVRAAERGERFVTLGAPYKLVRVLATAAPSITIAVASVVARLLPHAGGASASEPARPGYMHREGVAASRLTMLSDRAAVRNNEQPLPAT